MMKFWSTPQGVQTAPEIARFMNERRKYVASHTSFEPGWNNVTVISSDVPSAVKQLKEQPGKTIAIFGNNLVVSLMQAGLIDEFQILSIRLPLDRAPPVQRLLTKQPLHWQIPQFKSGDFAYLPALRVTFHDHPKLGF
jgi:dihydrofolate reductase